MSTSELPIDLIFALLLAAVAGWFAHQIFRRQTGNASAARTEPFSHEYFTGLNHLLNEQPDKALEVLRGLAEADANTVETQLALGHLYRRRGEVDKAIRVHESVRQRADLPALLRDQAAFALGEDYLRAGLLDRAEDCFTQLTNTPAHRVDALRRLLSIYEQQRDWSVAITTFERLSTLSSPEHPTALAHYYCELSEQAYREGDQAKASELLDKAFAVQRNFPRGGMLSAEYALKRADARTAALVCKRVLEMHPHLLSMALPHYLAALRELQLGLDSGDPLTLNTNDPAQRAALAYAALVANVFDEPYLLHCIPDLLRQDDNLRELVQSLTSDASQLSDAQLRSIGSGLMKIFRRTQRYRCVSCGVTTGTHFWQCPGCHSWDTLTPISRLELVPATRR
jgi:lipopolysaccharide assembly protein B